MKERWQNYESGIVGEVAVSSHLSYQLQLFEVIDPVTFTHTWRYQIDAADPVGEFSNKYDAWKAAAVALAALIGA